MQGQLGKSPWEVDPHIQQSQIKAPLPLVASPWCLSQRENAGTRCTSGDRALGSSPSWDWPSPLSAPSQPHLSHISPRAVHSRLGGSWGLRGLMDKAQPHQGTASTVDCSSQVISPENPLVLHPPLILHICFISGIWILPSTKTFDSKV